MKGLGLMMALLFFGMPMSEAQKKEKIKGDRNVTLLETPINSFNRIVVGERFKVDLIEGDEARVSIETDDNLQEVIEFQVADSSLSFSTNKRITTFKKMAIKVTYTRALKHIETQENGEVSSLTSVEIPDLVLSLNGSSKAFLNIKTEKLRFINSEKAKAKLNVNSSLATLELNENSRTEALINTDTLQVDMYQRANAKIEGDVLKLDLETDNNSSFVGKNLTANNADVITNLSSDAHVQVLEQLNVSAEGNSQIYIYENPAIRIEKFTGSAKLHKKEMKK